MKKKILITFALIFTMNAFSQVNDSEVFSKNKTGKPTYIKFKNTKVKNNKTSIEVFLKKQYQLNDNYKINEISNSKNKLRSIESNKFEVYYKDVKIEYLVLVSIADENNLKKFHGTIPTISDFDTTLKIE